MLNRLQGTALGTVGVLFGLQVGLKDGLQDQQLIIP
jgi:hypothetical protein